MKVSLGPGGGVVEGVIALVFVSTVWGQRRNISGVCGSCDRDEVRIVLRGWGKLRDPNWGSGRDWPDSRGWSRGKPDSEGRPVRCFPSSQRLNFGSKWNFGGHEASHLLSFHHQHRQTQRQDGIARTPLCTENSLQKEKQSQERNRANRRPKCG